MYNILYILYILYSGRAVRCQAWTWPGRGRAGAGGAGQLPGIAGCCLAYNNLPVVELGVCRVWCTGRCRTMCMCMHQLQPLW